MRYLNKLATVFCSAAFGMMALTGCEGGDLYDVNAPSWISEKVDSINNSKDPDADYYSVGASDYSTGWWSEFSNYYVVPDGAIWTETFNLHINPNAAYAYKNFALLITNDVERSGTGYTEYGAIRFDTDLTQARNSEWGTYIDRSYISSDLNITSDDDVASLQKLGGEITLVVDRSSESEFRVTMSNGTVTKTYKYPKALDNLNSDVNNDNIRCFLVPEGSYLDFESCHIEQVRTSSADQEPVSMVLNNIPDQIQSGTPLDTAMIDAGVTATVTYAAGGTRTVSASDLTFVTTGDLSVPGLKDVVAIYNKTYKQQPATTPITATFSTTVVTEIKSIAVTTQPTRTTYYYYTSPATESMDERSMAFDATGLVVTATYANGDKAVLDNSKLTFKTVPCEAGTHNITMATENGKTARVKITVVESEVFGATPSPLILGAEDNTTAWWGAHLDSDINIPVGKTVKTSFTNYAGGSNWNNWVVVLRNAAKGEYGVLRADNYGWGNGYAAATLSGGQADWNVWLAAMTGAKCEVYVTNCNNGTADVQAVMHGTDGNTYYQYYLGINTVDPADLYLDFTVDGDHLVFDQLSGAKKSARRK